jgi:1-phosphatidylinositol-3-phosphate 5-kinase
VLLGEQEEENLQNQVEKLLALNPDIILVERSVARTAQDELLERGVSLALNMKRSVLDFLARCTGAEVRNVDRNVCGLVLQMSSMKSLV